MTEKIFEDYIYLVEEKLYSYFKHKNLKQIQLNEAMLHSLTAGGKRIRPLLTIFFAEAFGVSAETALPVACCIEMIHTFSLIHDDLPCMDNDDFRRGKLSCHKAFDESTALLAGDNLSVYPFQIISELGIGGHIPQLTALKIIHEISNSIGIKGMIGGQQIDLQYEGKRPSEDELLEMYSLKTGALLGASCKCGCFLGEADEKCIENATLYAEKLGLAFQIIDDILDVTGNEQLLGKPIGSDKNNDKTTYVALFGIKKAQEKAEQLTNEAIDIISKFSQSENLTALTKMLLNRNK